MSANLISKNKLSQAKIAKKRALPMANKFQNGIALLEALIAILIFSFGVLGIVGLQGAMVKGTTQAKIRSDASYIAERRISMMWAKSANLASFAEVDTPVVELPAGKRTTTIIDAAKGEVNVLVRWTVPGEPEHNYSANAYVVGAN